MATFGQYFVFPVVWILSKLFLRKVEIVGEEHLKASLGKPAVLVANHISPFDSFLLRLTRHWKDLRVYFMGVTKFKSSQLQFLSDIGVISIVYKLFGVFTVVPGLGLEKNLQIPKAILARGDSVFIFPEGSINTSGELLPFKRGAAVLAISTGVPIIPIGFRSSGEGRKSVSITIGKPIVFSADTDPEVASRRLRDAVEMLVAKPVEKVVGELKVA